MHPNNLNYLLIDKDETLGYFPSPGLYHFTIEFLEEQHTAGKKLIIATTAQIDNAKINLKRVNHLIHTYLCREHFQAQSATEVKQFYITPEGTIRDIDSQYKRRMDIIAAEERIQLEQEYIKLVEDNHKLNQQQQQRIQEIRTYLNQLVDIHTKEPFTLSTTRYENPYNKRYVFKDLHLARRYLDPKNYMTLRTIMIGDTKDGQITPASDPYTPVIVINNQQRSGNWQPISDIINILSENEKRYPWQQFDTLYTLGTKQIAERKNHDQLPIEISTIRLLNQTYELDTANNGRRIIVQP